MESQPRNPEFRINPENFHPCVWENPSVKVTLSGLSTYEHLLF